MALGRGTVEGNHHEVEVHREPVHDGHLQRQRSHQAGHACVHVLVYSEPRLQPNRPLPFSLKGRVEVVALNAALAPLIELVVDVGSRADRLKPQRVAAEVERWGRGWIFWSAKREEELGPNWGQLIAPIELHGQGGVGQGALQLMLGYLPQCSVWVCHLEYNNFKFLHLKFIHRGLEEGAKRGPERGGGWPTRVVRQRDISSPSLYITVKNNNKPTNYHQRQGP